MPSFRAIVQITGLRPGNAPEAVMQTAVAAVASRHLVEANQLDIVRGVPCITVRFLVEGSTYDGENCLALDAAACLRHTVENVATTGSLQVRRRERGRWLPV